MKKTSSPEFESFREVYPERDTPDCWSMAWKNWKTRLREPEVTAELLTACAREYRTYVTRGGKLGTPYVMMAQTFLGPYERWKQYLPKPEPPPKPKPAVVVEERIDARPFLRELRASLGAAKAMPR